MPERTVERVLMTGDTVGGVWTFTLELARALAAHGIEVVLAAMGGEATREQQQEAGAIPNLRLFSSPYKLEWMDDPWNDVRESGRWLLDLETRFSPHVVHLNSYGHGCLPWRAPLLLTSHSCVLSWWAAVKKEAAPSNWARYRHEVASSLRATGLVTAPSRSMLQALAENYGTDLPPSRVIPNGRNIPPDQAGSKAALVLTAGRLWDEGKNVAAVVRAAANLPFPVYLAGESCHPNGNSVAPGRCRMLGRLSPHILAQWYARAAIYVLPARYEPFGLSILEAALAGCALVLGDIASLRELWEGAALFVPPDEPEVLETALRELMENPLKRQDLARRGTARAREFTPERMADSYADAYVWLSNRRSLACAS